jgi:hypothetical protein
MSAKIFYAAAGMGRCAGQRFGRERWFLIMDAETDAVAG